MFAYQKTNRYFAQISDGLEELGAKELASLGAKSNKTVYRGIYFDADRETLYRINYLSRLCTRVLAELIRFDCHSAKYLYKTALKLPWETLLSTDTTFAVTSTVAHSKIKHSHYAALRLKDAIADYFMESVGARPSVDKETPDVLLNLHVENNKAVINLDTSGGSLHRRGYRRETVTAPMQETLAAAIIALSGWDGKQPLYDPMCGSGTLLCEALMHYCRIPAQYLQPKFGFEAMPDFDPSLWHRVRKKVDQRIRELPEGLIGGSDKAAGAIAAARTNCRALPQGDHIGLAVKRYEQLGKMENVVIVSNPPYGVRMGKKGEIPGFVKAFGDFLKQRCQGSSAYLYFGNRDLVKHVGLRSGWKKPLKNGGLDGVLVKYDLY